MVPSTFVANVLVVGAAFVNMALADDRTCYHKGFEMSASELLWHSQRACSGYEGKTGRFQGTFGPGEWRDLCVNVNGHSIHMELQNLNNDQSFDIKDEDCSYEFLRIINECQAGSRTQGGTAHQHGWWFRIDPESAAC